MDTESAGTRQQAHPPQRRRGRGAYALWSSAALCLQGALVLSAADAETMFAISLPMLLLFLLWLSWRRFQDIGLSGYWSLLFAVPCLPMVALPMLWFVGGPRYQTEYGDAPEPSPWWLRLIALILVLAAPLIAQAVYYRLGWGVRTWSGGD